MSRICVEVLRPRRETGATIYLVLFWLLLVLLMVINNVYGMAGVFDWRIASTEYCLRLLGLIFGIKEFGHLAPLLSLPMQNVTRKTKRGKKFRPKRYPWFKRAQRKRACPKERRSSTSWESEPTEPFFPDWMFNYAHDFQVVCDECPDFMLLSGTSQFLELQRDTSPRPWWDDLGLPAACRASPDDLADLQFKSVYLCEHDDDLPIIFDSGASLGVSPIKSDFVELDELEDPFVISEVSGDTLVPAIGIVEWALFDDNGRKHVVRLRAFYVPSARVRLLSPQLLFSTEGDGHFHQDASGSHFRFPHTECILSFDANNVNLPIAFPVRLRSARQRSTSLTANVLDDGNHNLTASQKELLLWHFRLGHFNLPWIQSLTRVREGDLYPILPTKGRTTSSCELPKCAACCVGKMQRRADEASKEKKVRARDGILKEGQLEPGSLVHVDQFVSSVRGRLPHTKGKEKEGDRFVGGTIFVDNATGFTFVQMQQSLNVEETLKAKHAFEREAFSVGIRVRSYRGDNGVFRSFEFIEDLHDRGQDIDYAGVGGHHQNGVAENAIRTISNSARTMLLHSAIHWPDETELVQWPFAVEYAVHVWNRLPKPRGMSPLELWTRTKSDHLSLQHCHVWGSPVYVLDPMLQDGKKLPRWNPRARRGQFMGMSKVHASTVGMIRNLRTGSISPQFHIVFDDSFSTLPSDINPEDVIPDERWQELLIFSRLNALDDYDGEDVVELADEWLDDDDRSAKQSRVRLRQQRQQQQLRARRDAAQSQATEATSDDDVEESMRRNLTVDQPDDGRQQPSSTIEREHERQRQRRMRRRNPRYYNDEYANYLRDFRALDDNDKWLATLNVARPSMLDSYTALVMDLRMHMATDSDELLHLFDPMTLSIKANADDNPTLQEALGGPDSEGFQEAMQAEIECLESMKAWDVVPRSEAKGKNILGTTWVFKRKRYPDGTIRKLKARLCVRGDQQIEGVDFFETYAPVVQWSTVRLLLVMSLVLGLATKQVDYTLAFVHADIDDEVYVEMPYLFSTEGYVLRLRKSLYGLRQAPLSFFKLLKSGLEARGFVQSKYEPCLFKSKDCICLTYVDDCLFYSRSADIIDKYLESLKRPEPTSFQLNVEDSVAGFLGIHMRHFEENGDRFIELTQTGLIERVLAAMGMEDCKAVSTPAEAKKPLGKDDNGEARQEAWSYSSVVGMMMYLAANSRPDIAFAVHQCARFTHQPKRSHEKALKRIARYLAGTRTKGMILQPKAELALDMYCDADFAGLWNAEDSDDPICVRSRTGYVITLGEMPVLWVSKLQTEISLSTTEAEYIALSTGMRSLLPLRNLVKDVSDSLGVKRNEISSVSAVWEDNNACLKLVNDPYPNMSPRTKSIAVKYHWFREKIVEGEIEAKRIDTALQKADIFTKGLAKDDFERKRKMICGW